MFDLDRWQEIFSSIRSNMLRTVLSGFTVALGLYIFIVLFGIGTGLKNAFNDGFRSAQNLISISSGRTSLAYAGLQADRLISFNNDDLEAVTTENKKNIEYSSPIYSALWTVKYGKESGSYGINGAGEEEVYIKNRTVLDGRYLSPADIKENRNVAVIGKMVQRDLIKNGNPIGKELDINGTIFKVIGVFSDNQGDWAERSISIPITTMQQLKKSSDTISEISLTYNMELSPDEAIQFGEELKNQLQERKKVSPEDEQAIWVFNNAENTKNGTMFLSVIIIIVGFIGIGTLVAGIIGISNVLVVVEMLDSAVIESEFDMTGIRVTEVVVHGYLVFAAIGLNHQAVAGTGEGHIGGGGTLKTQGIGLSGRFGRIRHGIPAMTLGKDIGIRYPAPSIQRVIAGTAD